MLLRVRPPHQDTSASLQVRAVVPNKTKSVERREIAGYAAGVVGCQPIWGSIQVDEHVTVESIVDGIVSLGQYKGFCATFLLHLPESIRNFLQGFLPGNPFPLALALVSYPPQGVPEPFLVIDDLW